MNHSSLAFVLSLGVSACGGKADTSRTGPDSRCQGPCEQLAGLECGASFELQLCVDDCMTAINQARIKSCESAIDAYLACVSDASVSCHATGPYIDGCDPESSALDSCLAH